MIDIRHISLKLHVSKEIVSEHRFHPVRKWRFDYAHVPTKTAIEIEGGAHSNGRHTRGTGFINDMEKYNAAIELGWVVLRYTPQQIKTQNAIDQIRNVINFRQTYYESI